MTVSLELIVARDAKGGIGLRGDLPWHLPADLQYFQDKTLETVDASLRNAVIMGRKTWESIPEKYRPLRGRLNIVMTRQSGYETEAGVPVAGNLDEAIAVAESDPSVERVIVVGGGVIYAESVQRSDLKKAWVTEIDGDYECDTFFPALPAHFREESRSETLEEGGTTYAFVLYSPVGKGS